MTLYSLRSLLTRAKNSRKYQAILFKAPDNLDFAPYYMLLLRFANVVFHLLSYVSREYIVFARSRKVFSNAKASASCGRIVSKCHAIASSPAAFLLKEILDRLGCLAVIQPMLMMNTFLHLYLLEMMHHLPGKYMLCGYSMKPCKKA